MIQRRHVLMIEQIKQTRFGITVCTDQQSYQIWIRFEFKKLKIVNAIP